MPSAGQRLDLDRPREVVVGVQALEDVRRQRARVEVVDLDRIEARSRRPRRRSAAPSAGAAAPTPSPAAPGAAVAQAPPPGGALRTTVESDAAIACHAHFARRDAARRGRCRRNCQQLAQEDVAVVADRPRAARRSVQMRCSVRLVRHVGDQRAPSACVISAHALRAVGQALLQIVERGRTPASSKRAWLAWPFDGPWPRTQEVARRRGRRSRPTRHIISLPARDAFRFSGHCAVLKTDPDADRIHVLLPLA